MSTFDPDRFEDKYEHYFTELQQAYRRAFEVMSDRHDSDLVHAIDQRILAESEPFYEGNPESQATDDPGGTNSREPDGRFRIALPDEPAGRLPDRDPDRVQRVLDEYTSEIERQLVNVFDLEA